MGEGAPETSVVRKPNYSGQKVLIWTLIILDIQRALGLP